MLLAGRASAIRAQSRAGARLPRGVLLVGRCASTAASGSLPLPPGPKGWPLVGNVDFFASENAKRGDFSDAYKHGNIVRFKVFGQELVFLSDVDLAREVLKDKAEHFTNGDIFRMAFGHFFPKSVIVVEGEQWTRIRRILSRSVQGLNLSRAPEALQATFGRAESAGLTGSAGQAVDVHKLSCKLTFDAFGLFGYNKEFRLLDGENRDLLEACETVAKSMSYRMNQEPVPLLWRLPRPYNLKVEAAAGVVKRYAAALISSAMEKELGPGQQECLLDAMIVASRAEEDAKDRMTEEEMSDNICTIFFASYDTTAATIAFTMNFLAQHPEAQEKLRRELAAVDLAAISREELDGLQYLDWVAKESNRLCSTAMVFPRTAKADVQLGGYHINNGTTVVIDHTSLTARDPKLWGGQQDLDSFRPERWGETKPHKLASLPFGWGNRRCIGASLATMEHKYFTATLVKSSRWHVDPARPMELATGFGRCPKDGCWLLPEPWS